MITRFYSFEDAAIHAGVMRSQGYDAAVLDEVMGSYYGPLFSNGFRVWVSDEPVTGDEQTDDETTPSEAASSPAKPGVPHPWVDAVRLITGTLMMIGVLVLGFGLAACVFGLLLGLKNILVEGRSIHDGVSASLSLIIVLGGAALLAFSGPLMVNMTASLRNESSVFGWTVRAFVVMWVVVKLAGISLAALWVLWQMFGGAPPFSSP